MPGLVYGGCIGYADDVALISPTTRAMKTMLHVCDTFANEYDVLFNPTKSKYLVFGRDRAKFHSITWNDKTLNRTENDIHLGNPIGNNANQNQVKKAVSELHCRNNLLSPFSRCSIDVKYSLFKSLCMSVYGSQLWDLSPRTCEPFYVAWRKALRRLLMLSPRAHCALMPAIVGDAPPHVQLHRRSLKFLSRAVRSANKLVATCARLMLAGSGSSVSRSLSFLCTEYGIDRTDLSTVSIGNLLVRVRVAIDDETVRVGSAVVEFMEMANRLDLPLADREAARVIGWHLCVG